MKVLFSGFRDHKHSAQGGYDRIADMPVEKRVLLAEDYPLGHRDIASHVMRLPLTLLDIHTRLLRPRYDITHLFYGEISMIFFLPYHKKKHGKSVITLHLDIEKRRNPALFVKLLREFDGIVVLSSGMQRELKEKYGLDSVFIPHGFSKPVFTPAEYADKAGRTLDKDKINVITIGQMYRDYDTFRYAVDRFAGRDDICFHLVGAPADVKIEMEGKANVHVYGRLPDDQFYSLISDCDYCFLPLTYSTANNTLLEAQFLDLPSVLPKIDGVLDYAAPEPMNLFYSDRAELDRIFISLRKRPKDGRLAEYARRFDWNRIYEELEDYYRKLLQNP